MYGKPRYVALPTQGLVSVNVVKVLKQVCFDWPNRAIGFIASKFIFKLLLLQVMHTRDDHVVTVHHPNGLTIVEHSDGTRITTKRQEVLQEVSEKNIDNDGMESTEQVIEACIAKNKDDVVELDQEMLLPEAKDNTERDIQSDSNEDLKSVYFKNKLLGSGNCSRLVTMNQSETAFYYFTYYMH